MRQAKPFPRCYTPSFESAPRSGGFVLVAILVLVMLISMLALSLLFRLRAEDTAASASAGSEQAWAAAMSGVQEAMRIAAHAPAGATDWQDKPGAFRGRFVFDDGSDQWFFTVCSPPAADSLAELRYGLTDEASKLNINHARSANFSHFPHLTPTHITALRDWIDSNNVPDSKGAMQENENIPSSSRISRNAPLDTIDQLLLFPDVTPALLYGEDANQNWLLDPNENDGDEQFPPDNNDGKLDLGLREYLTAVSYDPNKDNDGVPRTNLNDPRDPLPSVELPAGLTNYIVELRKNGAQIAHAAELLESSLNVKDGQGHNVEIKSGIGKAELPRVLELFTGTREDRQPGLININTASVPVLATVPGINETLAESILSTRRSISPERRTTIAWLYQEGVVDVALFKRIAPHLTARSFQYSFHVVGYGVPSGRYRVLDAIIDLASGEPRLIYLRDLTRLGMPFRIEAERVESPVAQAAPRQEVPRG